MLTTELQDLGKMLPATTTQRYLSLGPVACANIQTPTVSHEYSERQRRFCELAGCALLTPRLYAGILGTLGCRLLVLRVRRIENFDERETTSRMVLNIKESDVE